MVTPPKGLATTGKWCTPKGLAKGHTRKGPVNTRKCALRAHDKDKNDSRGARLSQMVNGQDLHHLELALVHLKCEWAPSPGSPTRGQPLVLRLAASLGQHQHA